MLKYPILICCSIGTLLLRIHEFILSQHPLILQCSDITCNYHDHALPPHATWNFTTVLFTTIVVKSSTWNWSWCHGERNRGVLVLETNFADTKSGHLNICTAVILKWHMSRFIHENCSRRQRDTIHVITFVAKLLQWQFYTWKRVKSVKFDIWATDLTCS